MSDQRPATVLIVDDEQLTFEMLVFAMRGEGYHVEVAQNGMQALETYSRLQPEVVLLDIMMPGMDGFEVCRRIRELPSGERTAIVVLTSLQDSQNIKHIFTVGASDYVAKPFNMVELKQRVSRLLYTTQIERQLWETKERYTALFERSLDGVIITDFAGNFIEVNQVARQMMKLETVNLHNLSLRDLVTEAQQSLLYTFYHRVEAHGFSQAIELQLHVGTRQRVFVELSASTILRDEKPWAVQGIMRNITQRKQMERALKASESRYRSLFEDSPISLWEEDFSGIKQFIEDLQQQGVTDLDSYFNTHPHQLEQCIRQIKITDMNQATLQLYEAGMKEIVLEHIDRIYSTQMLPAFQQIIVKLAKGQPIVKVENAHSTLTGKPLSVIAWMALVPGYEESWEKVIVSILDITEMRQAAALIQRRELILEAVSTVASQFLKHDNWQDRLEDALAVLGKAVDAQHILYYDFDSSATQTRAISHRHAEWINPTFYEAHRALRFDADHFQIPMNKRWMRLLMQHQSVCDQISHLTPAEQEWLTRYHVRAILIMPVFVQETLWGFLVILDHTTQRIWSVVEQDALRVAADTLGSAILRTRILVAEREQRLFAEALRDINASITGTLDLNLLLDEILRSTEFIVPYESGYIAFVENDHSWRIARHRGARDHSTSDFYQKPTPIQRFITIETLFKTRQPVRIPDTISDPDWEKILQTQWIKSFIAAPIILEDQVIGFIGLNSAVSHFYTSEHILRLQALMNSVAIAIKNVRSFEQAQQLAALEERQRIARDLHDAVTQTIFSASTIAAALPRLFEIEPELVQKNLVTLHRLTRGALAELRILLHELRPKSLTSATLLTLLTQLAESIQGRTQIRCYFMAENTIDLPEAVKITFYRIAQEAVNNAVKHSRAEKIVIQLSQSQNQQVMLQIVDDGKGFDLSAIDPSRMGLNIMRERAAEQGIQLTISSQPGIGTEVALIWCEE